MAETVGSLVLGGLGLGELALLPVFGIAGTTVATAVGSAVIIGGSIGLQLLVNRPRAGAPLGSPSLPPPESGHQALRQSIPPRIVGYGRNRLAGSYVLFEADNGISYDVLAIHHGKIGGFVGYYLHDDVVLLDGSGNVQEQGDGRYGESSAGVDAITIKTRLGADTETAYSEITTPLSTIWTSAHRGDGIASLAMICRAVAAVDDFPTIYPRGKPEPSVVADCAPIYDPRDDNQDRDDPDTWTVSANPVLQLIDFLTSTDRGMGFDWETLIEPRLTALMVEADYCDALVSKADDSLEPRYASNGTFPLDADPANVLGSILDTCDGWLSEDGNGALVIKVGVYRAPEFVINSKHIRGVVLQYDLADEEAVNELTIDYTEPLLDYKTAPGDPWRNETDISERGRVLSQRLALPWAQSHSQARRIAKRKDAQNNAAMRGTITTTLYGLQALGERWITVDAPDFPDLSNVVIENRGITVDLLNNQVTIKFISVNPNEIDAWDEDEEEGSSPTIPNKLVTEPPPVPTGLVAVTTNLDLGAAIITSPNQIGVVFNDPGRSDLTFQVAWRVNGSGSAFTEEGIRGSVTAPSGAHAGKPVVPAGAGMSFDILYEVKMRSYAPAGLPSAYSSSTTVTI